MAKCKAFSARERRAACIEGRQLIDLLEAFPATLSTEELLALTRPLPPRAYSLASSRREVGEEAHLLVAAVRYESHGRARAGVASTYVADRLKSGASLRVRLKPNKHFRLPDPSADIIMVGPGTGVAPFRAFVQERRAVGATGRSWLFFGDRRYTHDFLYQLEWQDAVKDGSADAHRPRLLARHAGEGLRPAPAVRAPRRSRRLARERRASSTCAATRRRWRRMCDRRSCAAYADVKALSQDAAETAVAGLEREHRYLQDVY